MTIFETIGLFFVIFTCALASGAIGYFLYLGVGVFLRQRRRGEVEEQLDIKRQAELQFRHVAAVVRKGE